MILASKKCEKSFHENNFSIQRMFFLLNLVCELKKSDNIRFDKQFEAIEGKSLIKFTKKEKKKMQKSIHTNASEIHAYTLSHTHNLVENY